DDLEFATVVNGKFSWQKVNVRFGASPGYKFSIPIRGKTYSMKRLQLNGDGVYSIRANSPFAGYAYGFSNYDSYGYPTSFALRDLEKIDTVKPDPKWKVLCDGSVVGADGSGSAIVTDKLDNPNRGSSLDLIYMDLDSSYNYDFKYERIGTMIDGSHDSVKWSLNVVNPKLEAKAKIIFVDRAGNDTTIQVSYYPFDVAITGLNSTIQKVNIGKEYIDEIYLVNKRNTPAVVNNIAFTKVGSGFSIDNTQFPLNIAASDSVKLTIKFKSLKQGRFIDTLVVDNGCLPIPIVKGIVVADVVLTNISTNDIDFGEIEIGKKINLPFLVQNRGESILTITGYSLPKDSTIFKTINFPEISSQNPLVLTPGEIKLFNVEFSPLDMITYSDSINFTSDANNVDSIVKLTGKGKIVSSTNETDIIGENDITIVEEGRVLQFIVNNFNDESFTISLFDLLGNLITSQYIPNPFFGFTYSINGNGLANGVYMALVKQGARNYVKRLIIK
ncbi:MAG: choice-of-anchor D domain-containing protein, partial [Bacteroidota bacterium]